ncbi:uncharacterized protein L3040_002573 [Drepanopeziza brunnea f. sp. 'multigermtubi']|uniref:Uncharacterized protein n=1 Tax=Marssonina brunnea f. sp. multigermtubi (strain MB_m1) TaxID=1072389 RepID=K1X3E8_MARBU|nr:uncharacterized protein MBM_02784 [Drepanopeziza brunnea f. sp. 'multigermtubi' MB_m1]EKD19547.1 hypothetical protein MBM_02784 [Drepanopeziza brunnea f. sp. 'multigermtubi' MB_m1]KAJ5050698.1 hypothetical protein L3040_002573 [Drepanopeziza brunnea f. sp. 'multigermtubi']
MLQSKSILATLLALGLFFNGAQAMLDFEFLKRQMVVGYASVPRELAVWINERNFPYPEHPSRELGEGFSLVNDPGKLQRVGREEDWYCVVKGSKRRIRRAGKLYIPNTYTSQETGEEIDLWKANEHDIMTYSVTFKSLKEPFDAFRFAWAPSSNDRLQMLIPKRTIQSIDMKLWAQCFETLAELRAFSSEIVPWFDPKKWKIVGVS